MRISIPSKLHLKAKVPAKRAQASATAKPVKVTAPAPAPVASANVLTPGQKAAATKRAKGLDLSAIAAKAQATRKARASA